MAMFDFAKLPRISGHRGAKGTAPENTLASIRAAAEIGVSFVEFDVNLAGGNDLVVFHDFDLERCTNGSGLLVEHTFPQLQLLDAGSHFSAEFADEKIPHFKEAIFLLSELGVGANVEIKSMPGNEQATVAATAALIRAHWPDELPILLSSFSTTIMVLLRDQLPEISTGWLVETIPDDWREKLAQFAAVALHCGNKALVQKNVEEAKTAGYAVLVYTVNEPERAEQLLRWGVDSVISDNPERMMYLNPLQKGG